MVIVRAPIAAGVAALALALAGCSGGGPTGGTVGPPAGVTLLDVQSQVLGPRCALSGCHVGTDAPFDLDLSSASASLANLVDVPSAEIPSFLRVDPGNATDSYLFMKVVDDPRIAGDPMPAIGGSLSAGEIALIADWIDQGAR